MIRGSKVTSDMASSRTATSMMRGSKSRWDGDGAQCGPDVCGRWSDDGGEWIESGRKIVALRLRYLGDNVNDLEALSHLLPATDGVRHQDDSKLTITSPGPAGAAVSITLGDKLVRAGAEVDNSGLLQPGDTFQVTVDEKFPGDSTFVLTATDDMVYTVGFHTSCSNPLVLGDVYGSLEIVGWTDTAMNDSEDCIDTTITTTTTTTQGFIGTTSGGGDVARTPDPGDASAATSDGWGISDAATAGAAVGMAAVAALVVLGVWAYRHTS